MAPVCFLTGASGFVGANLAPMLAERYRMRCLVREGQQLPDLDGVDYERVEGDLENQQALAKGVQGADLVVHLAAVVSFRPEERARMFRINCDATAQLCSLAREAGVRRLLHVSTISAIGYSDAPRELDEDTPFNFGPMKLGYSDSKYAAEQAVLAEVERGLDAVIVNPPSMYGARDRRKAEGSLMDALMQGRIKLAPPGGLCVADVQSVCRGMLAAIDRGRSGQRYILGGENLTGRELFQRIAKIIGAVPPRRCPPRWLVSAITQVLRVKERLFGSKPPLTAEILALSSRYLWFSSQKAEDEIGYQRESVDAGIAAACAWLKERDGSGPAA